MPKPCMETTMIGVKEFRRRLSNIIRATGRGQRFTVVRYAQPVFTIEPIVQRRKRRYTIDDLLALRFRTKDKNLSKKVDEIVYGV